VFSTLGVAFGASDGFPGLEELSGLAAARGVTTAGGCGVRFVAAAPKPRRGRRRPERQPMAYERTVYDRGEVPTRADSWHDFFNALVWCALPLTKAALNERQCVAPRFATDADVLRAQTRTREQDRLAMFDEGGAVIVTGRAAGTPTRAFVLGHAVHELEVAGPADLTLMTVEVAADSLAEADAAVAALVRSGAVFPTGCGIAARRLAELRPLLAAWPPEARS
jgi:hypothetical protein